MLRERYELEADALWAHLKDLARRTPRLEGLYARDADPRVARLVQSAAFAFAVAHNRLDDDGQTLVRPLVARALPGTLRPRPSSTVLELSASSRSGPAGGSTYVAHAGQARVPFQVVWPATVVPMALEDVVLDRLDARRQVLRFALVSRSAMSLAAALPDVVRFFVHLEPRSVALDLVHALRASQAPGRTKWFGGKKELLADRALPERAVSWVQVDTVEPPLVSARADRFRSGSLLQDLYAFPEGFCFFDLHLGGSVERGAERLEVTLPLGHVVEGAGAFSSEHLRLFCAPATNQFVSAIEPVPPTGASEATLRVAGKPHAEILEVRALATTSLRGVGRTALRSWESPDVPRSFDPEETYFALEQRPAADDGRTELRATFGRLEAFPGAPAGIVEGEVLACDGVLTGGIGLGEVGSPREGGANITRVTPSRRALLGQNHAWRMSAYARMPPARLAECARLAEFLRLHDPFGMQDEALRIVQPAFTGMQHTREHQLTDGVLGWGDRFVLDTEATDCREGELWLLGALVHGALAERSEALSFVRLVLRRGGAPFADYGTRPGARLPFPLG
jgi:type VI protein secretion system component VasA